MDRKWMAYLINKYPVVQLISVNVTTIIRRISTKITLSKKLGKICTLSVR